MAATLVGCGHDNSGETVVTNTQYIVDTGISNAAQKAADSLQTLAAIEKARYPKDATLPFANAHSPELDQFVTVSWYGPLRPILQQIANQIGYTLQVYGKPPQMPILVRVDDTKNKTTAINVIRNLDLQATTKADILLYPQHGMISLRYHTHDS